MLKRIKSILSTAIIILLFGTLGCKKITTDLNVNPNVPSQIDAKYILSSALKSSADLVAGNPGGGSQSGNDLLNIYMGYWTVSGGYIPNSALLTYNITTDFGSSIWDETFITLANYESIISSYGENAATTGAKYVAIAKIMKAVHYQRLVDTYNNIPYSQALQAGSNNAPDYDDAATVYKSLVNQLDSAVTLISAAPISAVDPGTYDIMYGGNMDKWSLFAKTMKLKILMHLTKTADGPAYIQSKLTGLTSDDFIGANADAVINPGYTNSAGNQQNPLWGDIGYTTTGGLYGNGDYFRANTYAVNFYKNTNDPRLSLFYSPAKSNGSITGRIFGSVDGLETNSNVSSIGGNPTGSVQTIGLLKSPTQGAVILSSTESLFLQAEAIQSGLLTTGTAESIYQSAVAESFRLLGVTGYAAAATLYTSQNSDNVNFATSANKIKTIILQKWAALNTYDPLESWTDWRRLGIPSDLPVSIYPGTTAAHIPYRLLYPTSEYSYNTANVNKQGTIDAIKSKIFWMP
jgi:hypothetical protein